MWVKNILKAFRANTKVVYILNGQVIPDIQTVADYIESGLLTYTMVQESFEIVDNAIVIKQEV